MLNSGIPNLRERLERLVRATLPQRSSAVALRDELDFRRDLGLDSMGLVELVFRVEREFGVDIIERASGLGAIYTVGDLLDFVACCTGRAGADGLSGGT
jgi:acyl carrier protein